MEIKNYQDSILSVKRNKNGDLSIGFKINSGELKQNFSWVIFSANADKFLEKIQRQDGKTVKQVAHRFYGNSPNGVTAMQSVALKKEHFVGSRGTLRSYPFAKMEVGDWFVYGVGDREDQQKAGNTGKNWSIKGGYGFKFSTRKIKNKIIIIRVK